uniref:C2H2-type domain-containing protein n=1 Tax=Hippocampus comes TaxID=109280 RepID=A0A3Q2YBK5_HIPCM
KLYSKIDLHPRNTLTCHGEFCCPSGGPSRTLGSTCLDCGKSFRWSSRLTHHQRSHNNERPYRCNLCPKAFKGSSALLYHQRSHSGEKPYKCQDCGKAFKRSSLLQVHQSVHTGVRTFLCPYCPLTFKWSSHYQYHLRQHTGECPYPCDTCPKAFKNSSSLRRHKNVHLGLKPYTCNVCNKAFTQSTNLRQHMRIHTGERPYVCGECGRSFTHSSNLALHKNSHSGSAAGGKEGKGGQDGGPGRDLVEVVVVGSEEEATSMLTAMVGYVSQEGADGVGVGMEEVFLSTSSSSQDATLLPQLSLAPSGESTGASRAIGTEVHLSTDTGASLLLYSCGSCNHTFLFRSCSKDAVMYARVPSQVHTGVRAFQCPHCVLTFKWSSHYQYHLRQHTGERPYVCKECGKSFKNTSCLRRHSQMHSGLRPHVCAICSKSFSQTSNLKQHERTHSGERPFRCSHCNKCFTHSSNLQLHLRTHSPQKDFKCPYCSKDFVMHSYLQRHIRTHSSALPLPSPKGAGQEGVSVKASVGGVTTTTTLLNPITLESSGNNGSLIVSQPALNIPVNTSQNYFMIQTASGLQLIPLSGPTPPPAPPPPPPPPSQPQNFYLLQCPSTNGSQSSLILVPTANQARVAPEPASVPVFQTLQAFNGQTRAQVTQFPSVSPQHQQTRFMVTDNNKTATTSVASLPANSLLRRPILGKSNRTARGRRGRKPKSALPKSSETPSADATNGAAASVTQPDGTATNSNSSPSNCALLPTAAPDQSISSSSTVASTQASVSTSLPSIPNNNTQTGRNEVNPASTLTEKQFVFCFDNDGPAKEGLNVDEGGESYVLQFEERDALSGEAAGAGLDGEQKSLVLQFEANAQGDADKGEGEGKMMSLLQQWGGQKAGESQAGEEQRGQGGSFVFHFHAEEQEGDQCQAGFSQEHDAGLPLSCASAQALVPLHGQGVVFEVGDESKMEHETEEGMQMIALIEREGAMMGEDSADCSSATGAGGIFQLEGGDEIVIIEVSTSNFIEERMERVVDADVSQRSDGKLEGENEDAKAKSPQEHGPDDPEVQTSEGHAIGNGLLPKRCTTIIN